MAEVSQKANPLDISFVLGKAGFSFFKRAVQGPFHGGQGTPSYRRDVLNSGLRVVTADMTIAQAQYAHPTTETTYKLICRGRGKKPSVVDLGNGAKGLWIGSKRAEYVMLYIHGGGFAISATHGHVIYQFDLEKKLRKQGDSFAVFSLAYTLAPGAMYPVQLAQAASALRYLLDEERRSPSSIILAGDSAGGNLVSALLLHLAHPHPSAQVSPVNLPSPLKGALLISPWISFSTAAPSFQSNSRSDYITQEAVSHAVSAYVGTDPRDDPYVQPIKASAESWTKVVDQVVSEMMIWAGGGEVLVDEISAFASAIEKALVDAETGSSSGSPGTDSEKRSPQQGKSAGSERSRLNFVVTEKASHENMILDRFFLRNSKRNGGDIETWLHAVLSSAGC